MKTIQNKKWNFLFLLLRRSLSSIVIRDNAKIRLSELNENLFSYMSVRILSKLKTIHDLIDNQIFRKMKFLIFITLWISSSPQYSSNKFVYISVRRNLLRCRLSSIVIRDNAKIRLSELNENLFSYMSVRIISKSKTIPDLIDNQIFRKTNFFVINKKLSFSHYAMRLRCYD